MCLLAALVRDGARTRVTHAALTFTGSPETATMATSILRGGRYGCDAGVSAHRAAKGGRAPVEGPNQADCCCFLTEGAGSGWGRWRANLNLCGSFPRRDTAFLAAPVK